MKTYTVALYSFFVLAFPVWMCSSPGSSEEHDSVLSYGTDRSEKVFSSASLQVQSRLNQLASKEDIDIEKERVFFLAVRCRQLEEELGKELARDELILVVRLIHTDREQRLQAVEELAKKATPITSPLRRLVGKEQPAPMGDTAPDLLTIALRDSEEEVRTRAMQALYDIGPPAIKPLVREICTRHGALSAAKDTLTNMREEHGEAVMDEVARVFNDQNSESRERLVRFLHSPGLSKSARFLLGVFADNAEAPVVRGLAADVLGVFRYEEDEGALRSDVLDELYRQCRQDASPAPEVQSST